MTPAIIAWAFAVWDGLAEKVNIIAMDHQPNPKWNPADGYDSAWSFEIGEGGACGLGTPPGPGLWIFECYGLVHDPGDGWERDADTEIDGEWRALRPSEWAQIAKNPDLESVCALNEAGERIEWEHDMGEDVEDPDSVPLNMEPAPVPDRVQDEHGRIQYTATYRVRMTGEVRVTTIWAQPGSARDRLLSLLRRALVHGAAEQGLKLSTHEIATLIDPDSYVFDPPACDVGASLHAAT